MNAPQGVAAPATVRRALRAVTDPELPFVTIEDLGVLRHVAVGADGRVEVVITPTYSGCPAMDVIRADVERVLAEAGWAEATVRTVLAPAWTTDWVTDEGRRKLAEAGIAPPRRGATPTGPATCAPVELIRCPQCHSADTRLVSRFGSTACKALRVCNRCAEPFDHFKEL